MGRNLWYKLAGALIVVIAVVFWILSETIPESFGKFSLAWAGVMICGGIGLVFILQGCLQEDVTMAKKLKIWLGVVLIACAILCLISAITIPNSLILPIISLVIALGLVITILATHGAKWDEGDNHKKGYKNYFERKEEEDKEKEIEKKDIEKRDENNLEKTREDN